MTERTIKFLEDFKNNFGYTCDALSSKRILVLSKEDEEAKYYININFINKKITSYKTLKLTSKNYEELKKDMNSNKYHIAYAFPIEFDMLKYIVERLDMLSNLDEEKLTKTTDELLKETFSNAHRKPLEDIEHSRDDYDEIMRKAYYEKHRGDSFT